MSPRWVTSYLIEHLLFSPTRFWLPLILLDVVSWIKLAQTSAQTLCNQRLYRKTLCWEVCSQTQILFPGLISQADEAPSPSLLALEESAGLCRGPWGSCSCSCWKCCDGIWLYPPLSHITANLEVCAVREWLIFAWGWTGESQEMVREEQKKLAIYPVSEQRGSLDMTRKR